MTDFITPEWIKKRKEQADKQEVEARIANTQRDLDEKTIRADGPEFWKQFLTHLQLNVDSLSKIGLHGELADMGGGRELSCRVSISGESGSTYLNFFYSPGSDRIRCCPPDGEQFVLRLCVVQKRLMARLPDRTGDQNSEMLAEEAANTVVEDVASKMLE